MECAEGGSEPPTAGRLAGGVFRDEPPDLGHERAGDFDHGQPALRVCRFVFGDCFLFGLALVVCQQPLDALLVPAGREMLFLHVLVLGLLGVGHQRTVSRVQSSSPVTRLIHLIGCRDV